MEINGKRIFNYRPMCFVALSLVIGIIIGESLYGEHIAFYFIPALVFLSLAIYFSVFKKARKYVLVPIAVLIGITSISVSNAVYDSHLIDDYKGEFSATVSSEIVLENSTASFYIGDISIDGVELKYDAYVKLYGVEYCDFNAGDRILLNGNLKANSHVKFDTYVASKRAKGIGYFASVNDVKVLSEGKPKFPLNFQLAIKRVLYENLDEHTASICQALILGDKTGMDDGLYDNVKASGLAHVLAVSGLHISTLSTLLYFLLKKMKVNPKIACIAVILLTFAYTLLCSFTASSLRAFIMSGVFMIASTFGQKRDNLSALSLSAVLILIFRPTALMEVGFLLSFYAVLGIFLFAQSFESVGMKAVCKISPKRHIGTKFVKVCAVSFATNLMTYPLVAYFFGEVPTLFLLSNFVILPYIMAVYVLLLPLTLLSLITGFGGFVWLARFLLVPFRAYTGAIGSLSFASVPVSIGIGGIATFSLSMLILSKFVFLTRRQKAGGVLIVLSFGLALSSLFLLLP